MKKNLLLFLANILLYLGNVALFLGIPTLIRLAGYFTSSWVLFLMIEFLLLIILPFALGASIIAKKSLNVTYAKYWKRLLRLQRNIYIGLLISMIVTIPFTIEKVAVSNGMEEMLSDKKLLEEHLETFKQGERKVFNVDSIEYNINADSVMSEHYKMSVSAYEFFKKHLLDSFREKGYQPKTSFEDNIFIDLQSTQPIDTLINGQTFSKKTEFDYKMYGKEGRQHVKILCDDANNCIIIY